MARIARIEAKRDDLQEMPTHQINIRSRARFSRILIISVCSFLALWVLARYVPEAAAQADGRQGQHLTSDVAMLVDPTRMLQLDDVLTAAVAQQFATVRNNSLNLGYTTKVGWLRFIIRSEDAQALLLSLSPNFIDLIDVYIAEDRPGIRASDFVHLAMGDHRPLPQDSLSGLDNVVPLDLKAGKTVLVYIRVASVNNVLTLTASLYSQADHTFRTTVAGLAFGMWFGGMAVLLMIQAVFFYFDRKPYYLLLAVATFVAMLIYVGTLGLSRLFLFPGGGVGNDIYAAGTTWFGLTASGLAATSILELRSGAPWLNRFFQLIAASGLVGVVCAASGANIAFSPFGSAASVLAATVAAMQGLRTANRGGAGTRLRAAAYMILWLGLLVTLVQRTDIFSLPNWVSHTYAVSSLIQTVLLTGALGFRLRAAEALNRTMQADAILAAKAAERRANALVVEKTAELSTAKQVAEDALRAELASQEEQVRFMDVLGHQYRTPLAAIRSHVDAIGLSLAKADAANHRRVERIRLGIVRLVEVLEINLARSRLQGPSFQPTFARISLSELIAATGARGHDLLQREIRTTVEPGVDAVEVLADSDMLGVAIINLLENASKFSTLNDTQPIELTCARAGQDILVAVSDRGIGIPAAEIADILNRAVRGSNARSIAGTGMGLSLVSRIIKAHGGSIHIDSVENVGTTVAITLPVALPGVEPNGIAAKSGGIDGRNSGPVSF